MLPTQSNRLPTPIAMMHSPIPGEFSITNLLPVTVQNEIAVKAIPIIVKAIMVYSLLNFEKVLPKQIALARPKITQIVPGSVFPFEMM